MRADAAPAFLWLAELPDEGASFDLGREDAHYVARVCRARDGDTVSATDGRGAVARLSVLSSRDSVRLRVDERRVVPAPAPVTLACGPPEGERADWLVEKLAELGVTAFQPLACERGTWERFESRRERWSRLAIAALRQSEQAWAMELREPRAVMEWVAALPADTARFLADVEGMAPAPPPAAAGCTLAVGPSGGFSPGEQRALLDRGFSAIRLATGRLRTETAALAAAAWQARNAQPGSPETGA